MPNVENDDFGENIGDDEFDDIIQEHLFTDPLEETLQSVEMDDNDDFEDNDETHIMVYDTENIFEVHEHQRGTHSSTQLQDPPFY